MRDFLEKNNYSVTEAQARDVIDRCMKLLYYRDGRAYDKVSKHWQIDPYYCPLLSSASI